MFPYLSHLEGVASYGKGVLRGLSLSLVVGLVWGLLSLVVSVVPYDDGAGSRALLYFGYALLVSACFSATSATTYAVLSRADGRKVLRFLWASREELQSRLFWTLFVAFGAVTLSFMTGQDIFIRNRAVQVGLITVVVTMAYGGAYRAYRIRGTMTMRERDEYLIDRSSTGVVARIVRMSTSTNKAGTKLGLLAGLVAAVGCWLSYLIVLPEYGALAASVAGCAGLSVVHSTWLSVVLVWDAYRPFGKKGRLVPLPDVEDDLGTLKSKKGEVVVRTPRTAKSPAKPGASKGRKAPQRRR